MKLLYATPALFPIYFRAARLEAASYPAEVRRRIGVERLAATLLHLGVATAIGLAGGLPRLFWLYVVPVFLVFPPAFALNRLGQHYDVVPGVPARWSTRMARSRLWETVYLWSNYHAEHHYFPGVPFYRLPSLARALEPFYVREGIPARTYRSLLAGWLLRNRAPHTDWSPPAAPRMD
jgi:fatty acid desaturase